MNKLQQLPQQAEVFISPKVTRAAEAVVSPEIQLPQAEHVVLQNESHQEDILKAMKFQAAVTDTIRLRLVRETMGRLLHDANNLHS